MEGEDAAGRKGAFRLRKLIPAPVRRWLRAKAGAGAAPGPSLQGLPYIPYRQGRDYALPRRPAEDVAAGSPEPPLPPSELQLGTHYLAEGEGLVRNMLAIVGAAGFSFNPGDRILDLGCGSGRMIRHLGDLAKTCEIWGADINAESIFWCKRHLSPLFHFATTTRIPHLPFADGSLRFIYCGSLFTHIDDLTEAWLLELERVMTGDAMLYLTIHDEHTVNLLEEGRYASGEIADWITSSPTFQQHKSSFDMLSVRRDPTPHVFYHSGYLRSILEPLFDTVSQTREAYFYQTAFLLRKRRRPQ